MFGANSARPLRGWLKDLRDKVPEARILLYDHGKPKNGDGLETLARHLLDHVLKDRLKRSVSLRLKVRFPKLLKSGQFP